MMANKIKKIIIMAFDQLINLYFIFLLGCFITDYSFIFKDGVSNLSIHGIIFLLLLCARWFIDRGSFGNSVFIKLIRYIAKLDDKKLLFLIFIFLTLILFFIGLFRHFAFSSAGIDMGVTDQALWNTIKGRVLFSSIDGHINHLGAHFDPVLFLIAPLYFIWPNIIILIFLQALAVGLAVFPLYLIAKKNLSSRLLVFVFVFAFCLSRPLRGISLLDFHTDAFLVPLIFASYYLFSVKRTFWAVLSLVLMLFCKESAAILVFAYGVFTITYQKRYRLGISLLALAVVWWVVVTNLVMPRFAHTESYPYLNWLPFGASYSENITAVVRNPTVLIPLFFSTDKIQFYMKLFLPLAALSFLSPQHYVLFIFPLAIQVLGSINHPGMSTITSHYPAHTLPFIFIAAIFGARNLVDFLNNRLYSDGADRRERISFFIGAVIILFTLFSFGKSDGYKLSKFMRSANALHSSRIRQILRTLPQEASVSAAHRIVPHLTHRKYIYIWENSPDTWYLVEYVVLHRQLIERDKERFGQVIVELKERGYKEVYSDKYGDLFIFFNPMRKKEPLENIQSRIIPL